MENDLESRAQTEWSKHDRSFPIRYSGNYLFTCCVDHPPALLAPPLIELSFANQIIFRTEAFRGFKVEIFLFDQGTLRVTICLLKQKSDDISRDVDGLGKHVSLSLCDMNRFEPFVSARLVDTCG